MTSEAPNSRLTASTLLLGLVASLCCGGSLVFASVGLGAVYAALGLSRYPAQLLAVGALSIVGLNYLLYRRAATALSGWRRDSLRRSMFISASVGLAAMAASFLLLEWLNHAVVNGHAFLARPQYGQALIPGVPNLRLLYALGSLTALTLLWALPFPRAAATSDRPRGPWALLWRACVFAGTAASLVVLTAATISGADLSGAQHRVQESSGVTESPPSGAHTPAPHQRFPSPQGEGESGVISLISGRGRAHCPPAQWVPLLSGSRDFPRGQGRGGGDPPGFPTAGSLRRR